MPSEFISVNDITNRGNLIYTTGMGSGSAKWGNNLLNLDSSAAYLACHDTSGNFVFASSYSSLYECTELVSSSTRLFGVGRDSVKAFDLSGAAQWLIDASGAKTLAWDDSAAALFVAGTFTGSLTLSGTTLTSTGSDAYLARYTSAGALSSAINISSTLQSQLNSLVVVPSAIQRVGGKTYVAGTFGGALAFSGTTVTADTTYKAGFILAVSSSNQVEWVKTIDAQFLDRIYDIDIQGTTIYVSGSYAQRTQPLEFNTTIALPGKTNNSAEGYIAALDLSGSYLWVHKAGCNIAGGNAAAEQSAVSSIVATSSNNVYFTGNFATNPMFVGDMSLSFVNTTRQAYVGYLTATPTNPPAPAAPTDLSGSVGLGQATLTWSRNTDEGPTASYKLYYKLATSPTYTTYVDTSLTTVTVSGLTGAEHNFSVVAVGPLGSTSPFSTSITLEPASGAPSAPIDLSSTAVTSSSISITWTPNPASISEPTGYTVYYKVANRVAWDASMNVTSGTTATITGLQSYQDYRIAVVGYNSSGASPLSDIIIVRTLLGKPTGMAAQVSYNTITVLWNAIGNVSGYRVFYAKRAGFDAANPVWDGSLNSVAVYADVTGLDQFTEYAVAVAALVSGNIGELSAILYRTTAGAPPTPTEPRFFRATAQNGSVKLQWAYPFKPPTFLSIVDGYRIYQKLVTDASYSLVATVGTVLTTTVTDLSNGTSYMFYAAAYNAAGEGTASDVVTATPYDPTEPIITAVENPIVTPGAGSVLAYAADVVGATNDDEAAYAAALASVATANVSIAYNDTVNDIAVGIMAVADIEQKKAAAPTSILVDNTTTQIVNVVPPTTASFVSLTIKPTSPAILPPGSSIVINEETDVELKIVKYDASQNVVTSTLDVSATYTTVQFKRSYPVINVYKDIAGTYTKLITLYGTTNIPIAGIRETSGRCVSGNMNTGYIYEFTGPFSSVIVTNGTQSTADTTAVPCLVRGTRVRVPGGYKAVEELYSGDEVVTATGRTVRITHAYESVIEACSENNGAWSIPRGFFGAGSAPVTVSPNHAVKVPGVADAWFIPGYATADQKKRMKQAAVGSRMEYYHIELPNYLEDDLVIEGGAVVESYGTGWVKANGAAIKAAGGAVYKWSPKMKYFTRIGSAVAAKKTVGGAAKKAAASTGKKGKK